MNKVQRKTWGTVRAANRIIELGGSITYMTVRAWIRKKKIDGGLNPSTGKYYVTRKGMEQLEAICLV